MKVMTLAMGVLCLTPLVGLVHVSGARGAANAATSAGAAVAASQSASSRPTDLDGTKPKKLKDFKPNDQQIADAEAFIEKHSPNRFRAYKRVKETGVGPHANLKRWITRSHVDLKALENADPELYAMKLDELKIEDDIFGAVAASREKGDKLREELRPMIRQLEVKRKQEAMHRIEKIKSALVAEQKQLDDMNEASDRWIEMRLAEEMSRGGRLVPPVAARRDVAGPTTAEN